MCGCALESTASSECKDPQHGGLLVCVRTVTMRQQTGREMSTNTEGSHEDVRISNGLAILQRDTNPLVFCFKREADLNPCLQSSSSCPAGLRT
jgi:hypothetical protein